MIGDRMPAMPPMQLNTELVRPISRSGAVADTSDQWIDATPLQKKAKVRNTMISGSTVHVVGTDDAGGADQPADDRRLAGEGQAVAACGPAGRRSRRNTARHRTPRGTATRRRTRLDEGEVPVGDQVGREPRAEEGADRPPNEMTEIDPPQACAAPARSASRATGCRPRRSVLRGARWDRSGMPPLSAICCNFRRVGASAFRPDRDSTRKKIAATTSAQAHR